MSQKMYVGTRKGLFIFEKTSADWSISRHEFMGEPVSMLMRDPRDGLLYAALTHGHFGPKLHRSDDGGASWTECGLPTYPEGATILEHSGESTPAALEEFWSLEPGAGNRIWAGTIPGGLFYSDDQGTSWQLIESLWNDPLREKWMGGGKDHAGLHSICIDPRDQNRITVAVSTGGVWQSLNGGEGWKLVGEGLRAEYMPPEQAFDPAAQDAHLMVHCPASPDRMWLQHHNGIFKSENGGLNWTEIKEVDPSVFGFAVAVHPENPDVAWFVPATKDETRIPRGGAVVVTHTRDGGKTFEKLTNGLPQEHAFDIVYRHALAINASGETLAMGSTTGNLWISENQGKNWQNISHYLPPVYCLKFS
ncbi:MAG: exo-alpha-sialidase [Planctomycetaceae bacterium]|nr:exo-alpha-sialidase [Planctomycetaceae bacterium]